jgi:hypothetical protein
MSHFAFNRLYIGIINKRRKIMKTITKRTICTLLSVVISTFAVTISVADEPNYPRSLDVGPFVLGFNEEGDRLEFRSGDSDIERPFGVVFVGDDGYLTAKPDGLIIRPTATYCPNVPGVLNTMIGVPGETLFFAGTINDALSVHPANTTVFYFPVIGEGTVTLHGEIIYTKNISCEQDGQAFSINNITLSNLPIEDEEDNETEDEPTPTPIDDTPYDNDINPNSGVTLNIGIVTASLLVVVASKKKKIKSK